MMRLSLRALILLAVVLPGCGRDREPPPTQTPPEIALPAEPKVETIGGLQARRGDLAGLVADLVSAQREKGLLTITVRFRNAGTDTLRFEIPSDGGTYPGVRLTAGGRAWPIARDESDPKEFARTLAPGQSTVWRASFQAPPRATTTFDFEMPRVREPFQDVPITDRAR